MSLPVASDPDERAAIDAALRAWEGAGLGVRFVPVDADSARIEIRLEEESVATPMGRDTGNAVVDCRIAPLSQQRDGDAVVGATLERARLRIGRRTGPDWQGKSRALSRAELTGTLLHELGHALGFQGHARRGDTVMTREVERIPRVGKALLAGERFSDPTLRALYRLPEGAVAWSAPVEPWQTDLVDRMGRVAEENDLDGPFVRVGEGAARIFWRDAKGAEYGLVMPAVRQTLRKPSTLRVIPEPRARAALPPERDLRPQPR